MKGLSSGSMLPRGSKYSIFKASGPKTHTFHGIWDQSPEMLATWTLWVRLTGARVTGPRPVPQRFQGSPFWGAVLQSLSRK